MHITPIQLRFNDIDQMGHVNNAVIMEFFDLGKDHFFRARGLPPEEGDFTVMAGYRRSTAASDTIPDDLRQRLLA